MRIHHPIQRRIRPLRPITRTLPPPPPSPKLPPPHHTPPRPTNPTSSPSFHPTTSLSSNPTPSLGHSLNPTPTGSPAASDDPSRPGSHSTTGPSLSRGHSLNRTPTGSLSGRPAAAPRDPSNLLGSSGAFFIRGTVGLLTGTSGCVGGWTSGLPGRARTAAAVNCRGGLRLVS